MAAQSDTGNLTYYLNGDPIKGVYTSTVNTGTMTHYINGEFFKFIFPQSQMINTGNFFLMF